MDFTPTREAKVGMFAAVQRARDGCWVPCVVAEVTDGIATVVRRGKRKLHLYDYRQTRFVDVACRVNDPDKMISALRQKYDFIEDLIDAVRIRLALSETYNDNTLAQK